MRPWMFNRVKCARTPSLLSQSIFVRRNVTYPNTVTVQVHWRLWVARCCSNWRSRSCTTHSICSIRSRMRRPILTILVPCVIRRISWCIYGPPWWRCARRIWPITRCNVERPNLWLLLNDRRSRMCVNASTAGPCPTTTQNNKTPRHCKLPSTIARPNRQL